MSCQTQATNDTLAIAVSQGLNNEILFLSCVAKCWVDYLSAPHCQEYNSKNCRCVKPSLNQEFNLPLIYTTRKALVQLGSILVLHGHSPVSDLTFDRLTTVVGYWLIRAT